jgi:hypothetical protein
VAPAVFGLISMRARRGARERSNADNNADWDCRLLEDDTNAVIGRTATGTVSPTLFDLEPAGMAYDSVTIPALVTLPDNVEVHMTCSTGVAGSTVFDIQIVATSVGTVTVQCPSIPCSP